MRTEELLAAAGDLREHYAAVDWAGGPLGAVEDWPVELTSAVRLMLGSRFPITLVWGSELVRLYNAPYTALVGDKHPSALGRPTREAFAEVWDTIGPLLEGVLRGEGATWAENSLLRLERHGFLEDCYFTFSYSPIQGASGVVAGVIAIATETTSEVIVRRRLELLEALRSTLSAIEDGADLPRRALELLQRFPDDLPAVTIRRSLDEGSLGVPEGAGPRFAEDAHRGRRRAVRTGRAVPRSPGVPVTRTADLVVEPTDTGSVVWLPLVTPASVADPAFLVVVVNERLALDESYLAFLRLLAATLAQSLGRIEVLEAERLVADTERAISESLQLGLLAPPVETAGVEMAVRYLPSVSQARVGGDWYDAFHGPDGSLLLVLGDVAGHDRHATVLMAQARNIMRGIAYTLNLSPARTMEAFDRAVTGLDTDALLTVILARAVFATGAERPGAVELTWTNAGHPPPIVVSREGRASVLDQANEVLIGIEPDSERSERTMSLPAGWTLVLYTDGLIERRGESLDAGVERLRATLEGVGHRSPEEVADHLVNELGQAEDDDVAVLVVRVTGVPVEVL